MTRSLTPIFAAGLLLFGGMLPAVWAASGRLQQGKMRRIKVCIGIVPSMGEPALPGGAPNQQAAYLIPGRPDADPDAIDPRRAPPANTGLFRTLDNRSDLKPDGWSFYNPAAPLVATEAQAVRWNNIVGGGNSFQTGMPVAPDMGMYWEVLLKPENFTALAEMDVIYIPIARCLPWPTPPNQLSNPSVLYFTEAQRRLLTRLADSGVTLWIDWTLNSGTKAGILGGQQTAGTPTAQTWNPFFTNLDTAEASCMGQPPLLGHPLLDARFKIEPSEAINIGAGWGVLPNLRPPSRDRVMELRALGMQPTSNWVTVVPTSAGPPTQAAFIAATRYGSGFVVASAGNAGGGAAAGSLTALKFAYNMVAWRDEVTSQQKNERHTASSDVPVQGVIQRSTYPDLLRPAAAGNPWIAYPPAGVSLPINTASPLVVNGTLIAYSSYRNAAGAIQSEINAFGADPEEDFDSNRYADDGPDPGGGGPGVNPNTPATNDFVDLSLGQSYDRLMGLPVPSVFGMTVGEVPDATTPSGARAFVFAAGENVGGGFGGLYSLPVPRPGLPVNDYWNVPGVAKSAPAGLNIDFLGAPGFANIPGLGANVISQLYAGGVFSPGSSPIFGSQAQGKMIALQVGADGNFAPTPNWFFPANNQAAKMGAISGPVTVAQVMDEGTGAIDTMAFATTVSSGDVSGAQAGGAAGDTTGKVLGWVVSTRAEPLSFPRGNNQNTANSPTAGNTFVAARWLDVPPGTGVVPQNNQLIWDQTRHYEVRVVEKATGYVLARFLPATPGFQLLRNGTAGQVQLPPPTGPLAGFALPQKPNTWDLNRFVLLADYTPLPVPDAQSNSATMQPLYSPQTPYERGQGQNQVQPTGIAGGVAVGSDNLQYYGTGQGFMCAAEWRKGRPHFRWKMRSLEYADQTGTSNVVDPRQPGYLADYAFVAAPAAGERVVFAARGRGGATGTVYVLEPDAVIRFKLRLRPGYNLTPARARDIMLEADHGAAVPQQVKGLLADQQPWGRVPGQFTVDPDTATVTFLNMENFSLDLRQARTASELLTLGIDTGGRPAVPIRWGFRNVMPGVNEPSFPGNTDTAWIPLPVVALYRSTNTNLGSAQTWSSGAVMSGDKILLMSQEGYLHQLPLDPKKFDPQFPRDRAPNGAPLSFLAAYNMGERTIYGLPGGVSRTVNVAANTGSPCIAAPAVSDGVIAVSSPRGLTMYGSPNVIVADANRIIEASGDSTALAVTDVVLHERNLLLSDSPQVFPASTSPELVKRSFLSRPARVIKLNRESSLSSIFSASSQLVPDPSPGSRAEITEEPVNSNESFLVADTGNNRIVEFNSAGRVIWELDEFRDPFSLLPSGEPLKLSGPLDVQRWIEQEQTPNGGFITVVHTLVCDTGNFRVIEVVDKIGAAPAGRSFSYLGGWRRSLVWTTQTNAQGLRLPYRTAQRIFWPDRNGGVIPTNVPNGQQAQPPFGLPAERFVSYTMASVGGVQVEYPEPQGQPSQLFDYLRVWPRVTQEVLDRKPLTRPGGDSIVFLRGRYHLEPGGGGVSLRQTPVRERRVNAAGAVIPGDNVRYSMGTIDPFIPIITQIHDELLSNGAPASQNVVHKLTGVNSVQRTIRADVKFDPGAYSGGPMTRAPYFLIADAMGVWELRMLPGRAPASSPAAPVKTQFRLSWAFTSDDYARVTGTGALAAAGRRFTPFSARRLPNRTVLIASRTPSSDIPPAGTAAASQALLGADVFMLRSSDFTTATERALAGQPVPYDRANLPLHGWRPDLFAQPGPIRQAPSIRWRAGQQIDEDLPPTLRTAVVAGTNPTELRGSYQPVQPSDADIVF